MIKPSSSQPEIFDRSVIRKNRNRAFHNFKDHDFLFTLAGKYLNERLEIINREFPVALQIGARSDKDLEDKIIKTAGIKNLYHMDIAENFLKDKKCAILADEEFLPFKKHSLDLIISPLSLHSVNDLPGTLAQINYALKPDGLFLACIFGGATLDELRNAMMAADLTLKNGTSPHIAPFIDKQQMGALMQRAGFALPVIDSEEIKVSYSGFNKLLSDLKFMGEANAIKDRLNSFSSKSLFKMAKTFYKEHYSEDDGKLCASFEMIFMIGWAPHKDQQQPLKPGSAQHSLADTLNVEEIKTGDIALP
jgi:SAM-dependent methyltransferase